VIPDFVADTWKGEKPASFNALDEMPMHAQRKHPHNISEIATDLLKMIHLKNG
jgi:hypothetical protein